MLYQAISGMFYLSNYQIRFCPADGHQVSIPLGTIWSCSPISNSGSGTFSYFSSYAVAPDPNDYRNIEIMTKDMRKMSFTFEAASVVEDFYYKIGKKSFWKTHKCSMQESIFAFAYRPEKSHTNPPYSKFDFEKLFERLRLSPEVFRISDLNHNYSVCPSYPSRIIVPKCVTDDILRASAKFRGGGRLPAITWVHCSGVTLSRCAQPQTSFNAVCADDEMLVRQLVSPGSQLLIIDARAQTAATANCLVGGGYETASNYNCQIEFQNIDNIHAMEKSFRLLTALSYVPKTPDRQAYESTKWLNHVGNVLQSACNIADMIQNQKKCVLVHCTDGWDRTSQLVSLAQIFLDPFYRTTEGFASLIRKDWLAFGHQFATRLAHGQSKETSSGCSPTFVQWMDCVYQCLVQYPNWFQFNQFFLIDILDELYNCRFGTFLLDNERQRQENNIDIKTESLWPYLEQQQEKYLNPNYFAANDHDYFLPRSSTTDLQVWTSYYGRYRATMKYHNLHNQQTLDRLQNHSFIVESQPVESERGLTDPNLLKDLMMKMFKKEFQEQLENVRHSATPGEMIFEVDDHKFKFIVDNNKIRVVMCSPHDAKVQENKQIQVPKFCGNENFVIIDNYIAKEETTESQEVVLSTEEIDDFLRDMVQIEEPGPREGLTSLLPSRVVNLYDALPPITSIPQVAVGGISSVTNWWFGQPAK
jgi:myotubularin-related protein 1/2